MTDQDNAQYLSQEKFDSLQEELQKLKSVKVPALAKRIDEARQLGDLSENAEYHSAREEMSWVVSRVKELEQIFKLAVVVAGAVGGSSIKIGSQVVVKINGVKKEYTVVGAQEANPAQGKISNESPLGEAFLGKKKNDKVQVTAPAGVLVYEILEIK